MAKSTKSASVAKPVLLAGGNPQIAKADGDTPVQAYIAAMPGWKRDVGRRLDALIVRTVPNVRKAVRWNSPFYGREGEGWFLNIHCLTRYIKVAFFRGTSLRPVPPVESKKAEVRYFHIHEDDQFDEASTRRLGEASQRTARRTSVLSRPPRPDHGPPQSNLNPKGSNSARVCSRGPSGVSTITRRTPNSTIIWRQLPQG